MLNVACKNDNTACPHFLIISPDPDFLHHFRFRSITLQPLEIPYCYLVGLKNRSVQDVACKIDISAFIF